MDIIFLDEVELESKISQFLKLYQSCFTAEISPQIIRHRYIENPYNDILICVVEDNGKLVANYSVVPLLLEIDGVEYKAALSLNTMTHPEYEGQGLFVKSATLMAKHLRQQGYSMVYGFPNNISNGIFSAKLGWRDIYEIPTLELQLNKVNKDIFCSAHVKPDPIIGDWSSISTKETSLIFVKKDETYLKWRYKENPYNDYEISRFGHNCWAIHHVYKDELNLTEFHHNGSIDMIHSMINYYINLANDLNLKKITTWCGINTLAHLVFERTGFINKDPIRYFCGKALAYDGNIDLYDYRNWNVQMGDDNVY